MRVGQQADDAVLVPESRLQLVGRQLIASLRSTSHAASSVASADEGILRVSRTLGFT